MAADVTPPRVSVRAALRRAGVVGGPEARATPTGRDGIRVVDREPGAHQGVDVRLGIQHRVRPPREVLRVARNDHGLGGIRRWPDRTLRNGFRQGWRRNPVADLYPSIRSMTVAIPCPTAMHMVASPQRPPVRRSSWVSIVIRRAPLIPSGWPSAIAPPLTLTFAGSSPSSSM